MKGIFDLQLKEFIDAIWHGGPYLGYHGPIIGGSHVVSVTGGFGNILYQQFRTPTFDLWQGDYRILEGGEARARSPIRSIELNCFMGGGLEQQSAPFVKRSLLPYSINLSHTLAMDSKVKLIRNMHYWSFDLHYSIKALYQIRPVAPALIDRFINEYEARRQFRLFAVDIQPSKEIIKALHELVRYVRRPDMTVEKLEYLGIALLIKVFIYKRQLSDKKGLDQMDKRILSGIEQLNKALLWEIDSYETTKFYAYKYVGTNESDFRKHFKKVFEMSAFDYWRKAKMDRALHLLLNTNMPIYEIAIEAGFVSPKAFTKAFKHNYDEAPSDYRTYMSMLR